MPETVSFQLDVADIDQIIAELNRLRSKIGALKQMVEANAPLVNPTKSLEDKK